MAAQNGPSMSLVISSSAGADAMRLDAVLAVTLLFAVVIAPTFVGLRMMYTVCWLFFTSLALLVASDAALGIATSMGITIMVGWYALRFFDRSVFKAGMNGWLGVWASSPLVQLVARVGDVIVHLILPMMLIASHLPLVRLWMSIPALISSRLWVHFVVGGGIFPKGDHIFRFTPPRSQHFWNAAYKIELLLNLCVPLFCVLAHQRSFWVYAVTALGGIVLCGLRIIRSLSLKRLRANSKKIMSRLLAAGGLQAPTDFVARDDAIYLDWMRDGLIAIGETYIGGLWEPTSIRTLDEVVTALMTIPMQARQEMYRSWSARMVALAARMFNYPPSSKGLVVGAASEQFDLSPQFRRAYMGPYLLQGFGIWTHDTRTVQEAQTRKLESVANNLELQKHHRVLDLCIGSCGGVGIYLAQHHPDINVLCILTSYAERVYATHFAEELGVLDRVDLMVVDSPDKLLTTLCAFNASRFDRIVGGGIVEAFPVNQLPRFFRTLKRIQATGGWTLLDLVVCPAMRSTVHAWNNKYINGVFPANVATVNRVQALVETSGFVVDGISRHTEHFERTFVEWHRCFQAHLGGSETPPRAGTHPSQGNRLVEQSRPPQHQLVGHPALRSLPDSFRRTWEFYLLHSAACYRAQVLQAFQMRIG